MHRVPNLAAALLLLPSLASAVVWRVVPDGSGDAPTIQAAMSLAADGDTILLAPGTFTGSGNVGVQFGGKDVAVVSEAGPAATVIDCQETDRAFVLVQGETSAASIAGVTVRNGRPPAAGPGGAVLCIGSAPTITDCDFLDNTASGGLGAGGGAIFVSASTGPTIVRCRFAGNRVVDIDGVGGGISLYQSGATISDCTFEENSTPVTSLAGGGGVFGWFAPNVEVTGSVFADNRSQTGGGLCLIQSPLPVIEGCRFERNVADGSGGGACLTGAGFLAPGAARGGAPGGGETMLAGATITGTTFANNVAGLDGGGLYAYTASFDVESCTLHDNSAARGGGVWIVDARATLASCTLAHNVSPVGGNLGVYSITIAAHADLVNTIVAFARGTSATCIDGASIFARCTDVYGNADGDWVGCLAGQAGLQGNFAADPFFCAAAAGDYSLRSDSPCAPPGVTGCGLVGALPVGCGPTSVGDETWGCIKGRYR